MLGRLVRGCSLVVIAFTACGRAEEDGPGGASGGVSGGRSASGGASHEGGVGGIAPGRGGTSSLAGAGGAPFVTGGVATSGGASAGGAAAAAGAGAGADAGGDDGGGRAQGGTSSAGAKGFSGGDSARGGADGGGSSVAGAGGEGECSTYALCGCGCCGTGPTRVSRCYYPEAGERLDELIAADREQASNPGCANAGCALGELTACCLRGTAEAEVATYTASYYIGGIDRITINKTSADGFCATAVLAAPISGGVHAALETPGGAWSLQRGAAALCAMSATWPEFVGATGSVTARAEGNGCVLDIHATFFTPNASGGVSPVYFEADGVPLSGPGPSFCR